MTVSTKFRRGIVCALGSGTFLGALFAIWAVVIAPVNRSLEAVLILWAIGIAIALVGIGLFSLACLGILKNLDWPSSSRGFAATCTLFGGSLGALNVLRHDLFIGAQVADYLAWIALGAATGCVAAAIWSALNRTDHDSNLNA